MLKNGKWSFKYDCCTRCKRTKYRHKAVGLCKPCYGTVKIKKLCRYGGNWLKQLARSPACEICSDTVDLVVHHIDQNKRNHQIDNFSTLCRACHSRLHKYATLKLKFMNFEHLIK